MPGSNYDHFEPLMELAPGRVPALQTAGIKDLVNGPESFTPLGNFILGQAPNWRISTSARALTPTASRRGAAHLAPLDDPGMIAVNRWA